MPSTIFVIDSSPAVRRMVEQISTPAGYDVVGFQDGPAALEAARRMSPTLIITDYHLNNMTFSGFCKEVHKLDNLTDTYIIALTGATDKFDDSHLKTLGVKAFLKKPFQSEHLLDLIKDLDRTTKAKDGGKKKRSWPPTSSATDSDDDPADDAGADEEIEVHIPYNLQPAAPEKKETPVTAQAVAPTPGYSPAAESEEAMKGVEKKIAEMLPQLVSTKLEAHVVKSVEAEVRLQIGASLSDERLTEVVEPLLMKALPKVLTAEMAVLEPVIRHSIFEIATPLIKEQVERMVREQADTVKQLLPDAVRDHLRSTAEDVREQVKQAAEVQTERVAADMVRAVAAEQVQTTVEQLIPTMVEEQIKAEIRRLTEAA